MQDSIDDFIGKYEGRLGDVKLLERRGNALVVEVTYDNVRRRDRVYVKGEVLAWGEPLEGFTNTLGQVTSRHGKVILTIGRNKNKADDDWGVSEEEVASDQIRLSLVRETHPDKLFGGIIYDLPKTWNNSNEPDALLEEAAAVDDSDGIELADDATTDSQGAAPATVRPMVVPGLVLRPVTIKPQTPVVQAVNKPQPMATVNTVAVQQLLVSSYDFYANAKAAKWKSKAGSLKFPGARNDRKGFVRTISQSKINPDNLAKSILQTHPQWAAKGWIEGRFPPMTLGKNLKFKTVAGFLKGANRSDGVSFHVYVLENGRATKLISRKVSAKRYVTLAGDLSPWAGKKIQIILRVLAGNSSAQDWAVWVKPRITK